MIVCSELNILKTNYTLLARYILDEEEMSRKIIIIIIIIIIGTRLFQSDYHREAINFNY